MSDRQEVIVVVDRKERELRLKELESGTNKYVTTRKYEIAIGAVGYRTEPGYYQVREKAKNPEWQAPDAEWVAPEWRGKIVPGGDPQNPIRERWIEINSAHGEGIHGTFSEESLGTRASHGCIRMRPDEVIDLYDRVPKGSIVHID